MNNQSKDRDVAEQIRCIAKEVLERLKVVQRCDPLNALEELPSPKRLVGFRRRIGKSMNACKKSRKPCGVTKMRKLI